MNVCVYIHIYKNMLISCNIPQGSDIRAGRGPRDHPSLFFLFCQQEKLKPEEVK